MSGLVQDKNGKLPTMRSVFGLTLIELLIAVAIIGIVAGLGAVSGHRYLQGRESQAAVNSVAQGIWQGATAAAARGVPTYLRRTPDSLLIVTEGGEEIRSFELPEGTEVGDDKDFSLSFTPPGRIEASSFAELPSPLLVIVNGSTYSLDVSLIGEVRVR